MDLTYRVPTPFVVMLYRVCPTAPERLDAIALFIQPMEEDLCRAQPVMYLVDAISDHTSLLNFEQVIFLQDRIILENQRPLLLPLEPRSETPTRVVMRLDIMDSGAQVSAPGRPRTHRYSLRCFGSRFAFSKSGSNKPMPQPPSSTNSEPHQRRGDRGVEQQMGARIVPAACRRRGRSDARGRRGVIQSLATHRHGNLPGWR